MSLLNNSNSNNNDLQKQNSLSDLIDSVSNNKLSLYYPENNSSFIKKIDKLNLSFYIETEKILSRKRSPKAESQSQGQGQDTLFLLLFKQINLYIAEIERLNILIKDYEEKEMVIRNEAKEEKKKRRNEISTKDQIISALRTSNNVLEAKLLEQIKMNNTLYSSHNTNMNNKEMSYINTHLLKIEGFSITIDPHTRAIINIGSTNESIIMNGANAKSNQKKQSHYLNIRYYSKEEKPNETMTPVYQKRIYDNIQKKKGMKIIKNVKAQYSQIKGDSIELLKSKREMNVNGRINSDITDCNNTVYIKSQRTKQRKILFDSCKTHQKIQINNN